MLRKKRAKILQNRYSFRALDKNDIYLLAAALGIRAVSRAQFI